MAYTTINKSTDYFNTLTYTGDGTSSRSITGVGFQPDWTWFKSRSGTNWHNLYDAVRGVTKAIITNETDTEATRSTGLLGFNSDGFTVGADSNVNGNTNSLVAWNWKANGAGSSNTDGSITSTVSANTTAGFSIVTYTGTGSTATVGHGLGVKPDLVIYKERNNTNAWRVMHDINGTLKRIYLNATDAEASIIDSSTAPTNTVLNIGTGSEVNRSSGTFVAYCFAEKTGYSKIGSYVGNDNVNGTFVYTGFKPSFVLIKRTNASDDWYIYDNKRDGYNVDNDDLHPNNNDAEDADDKIDLVSNGFKLRAANNDVNGNGDTYIYYAVGQSLIGSNNVPCTAR